GAIVGTTWGLLRALAAEKTARAESLRADGEKQAAEAEKEKAVAAEKIARAESLRADGEKQAAEAEKEKAVAAETDTRAFSDFLLFNVLAAARLKGESQRVPITTTIAQSVTEAEKHIDEHFQGRPTAEADVRHALGVTWRNLSKFDRAEKHFRRALELRR